VSERPSGRELEEFSQELVSALNWRDVDGFFKDRVDPELEFKSRLAEMEGRVYRGIDGLREWFSDVDAAFTDARWELLRVIEISDEIVVVEMSFSGKGKASGVPVEIRTPQVWTWRDGRPWRNEVFTDLDSALASARSAD
jgi:ketosteroid isomerase-like protein